MDSMFHSTVMRRPAEEEDETVRRERMNGAGSSNTRPYDPSPTQTDLPSFSPTHPRPQFTDPYHPPTPATLPMTTPSRIPASPGPASRKSLSGPSPYQNDYQPPPRDKPISNYYDPTSDSGERPPADSSGWGEGKTQVRGWMMASSIATRAPSLVGINC